MQTVLPRSLVPPPASTVARSWRPAALLLAAATACCLAQADPEPPPAPSTGPSFQQARELTDKEATALAAVRDRVTQLDETAFYLMIRKADTLGRIQPQDLDAVDRPAPINLLHDPARYRGRPVRLALRVHRVQKLAGRNALTPSPYWAADRPVWRLDCVNPAADIPAEEPLVVFTPFEPAKLPPPDKVLDDDEHLYFEQTNVRAEAAGFFYKVWKHEDLQEKVRMYPVMIAWSVEPAAPAGGAPARQRTPAETLVILAVVPLIVLLAAFLIVKRYARRRSEPSAREYRPIRREPLPAPPEEPRDVDPELQRVAQEYQKEKGRHDDPDNTR